jgi:MFS family permease
VRQRGYLLATLRAPGFGRLLATRLLGQFGDGVFQASLAGAVLFNPERQAHAADVAAGFAVLLLPYSVVGPFAGVFLDRWRRRRTLIIANVVRAAVVGAVAIEIASGLTGGIFYATGLVVVSLSRFILSALSAGLPHVVRSEDLVAMNGLSTTAGVLMTSAGGAAAIGVRALSGGGDGAYAAIAVAAAVPYLLAAVRARPFAPDALGPDDTERAEADTVRDVLAGFAAGARHLRSRKPAARALLAITIQRLGAGITTVCTLLLYRNYFTAHGVLRTGLSGLAQAIAALAVGGVLAAVITPAATRRLGYVRYPALLLLGSAAVDVGFVLPFRLSLMLVAALLLGFTAQSLKICVDTVVQRQVDDDYRGRVFSVYDTLFNLTLVLAAVITAVALPPDGRSPAAVIVIAAGYLATAAWYSYVGREERDATETTRQTPAQPSA